MISREVLRHYPHFGGISEGSLDAIAAISGMHTMRGGSYLFREGEPAHQLYILTEGEVDLQYALRTGEPVVVDTIVAGELLGWSAVVPPYRVTATAIVRRQACLVAIQAAALRRLCEQDPVLGFRLMSQIAQVVSQRLEGARVQLAAHPVFLCSQTNAQLALGAH